MLFIAFLAALHTCLRARADTALEILALRQQVAVLKRRRPRPPLTASTGSSGLHSGACGRAAPMSSSLSNQKPLSHGTAPAFVFIGAGDLDRIAVDPRVAQELQDLIARMAEDNPDWGAPKTMRSCRSSALPSRSGASPGI
jgi:hypothetical protein